MRCDVQDFVDDYMRMVAACAERDKQGVIEMSTKLGFLTGEQAAHKQHTVAHARRCAEHLCRHAHNASVRPSIAGRLYEVM